MDQLKLNPHPLEGEVDRIVKDLGGDLNTMKLTHDTGISYNFNFEEVPTYIALPTYVPKSSGNLVRVECDICVVEANEVGRILYAIALDMDMNRHHPIRVVPRTRNCKAYTILLQFVCPVVFMQTEFIAQMILNCVELASYYREELFVIPRSG